MLVLPSILCFPRKVPLTTKFTFLSPVLDRPIRLSMFTVVPLHVRKLLTKRTWLLVARKPPSTYIAQLWLPANERIMADNTPLTAPGRPPPTKMIGRRTTHFITTVGVTLSVLTAMTPPTLVLWKWQTNLLVIPQSNTGLTRRPTKSLIPKTFFGKYSLLRRTCRPSNLTPTSPHSSRSALTYP